MAPSSEKKKEKKKQIASNICTTRLKKPCCKRSKKSFNIVLSQNFAHNCIITLSRISEEARKRTRESVGAKYQSGV